MTKAAFETRNDLPSNTKAVVIGLLNRNLAALIDLALTTKQAHWNVKGMQFIAVHEMLDGFRDTLDTHADSVAERVVQLGGIALGTLGDVSRATALPPYPTDISSVEDHLKALAGQYGAVANLLRASIEEATDAGDAGAADIFTAASRDLDKALWFIEAHLQG